MTFFAKRYFTSHSPVNVLDVIKWQKYINYKAMFHLTEAVKQNTNVGLVEFPGNEKTLYERLAYDETLNQIFQDAMENISKQAAGYLSEYLDVSDTKYLVDVGGGDGTVITAIAKKNPTLHGAVMDLTSVGDITNKNLIAKGVADRIDVYTGNCFNDPFPKQADMILFCHFLLFGQKRIISDSLKNATNSYLRVVRSPSLT